MERKKTQIIETIELKHHQILLLSIRNFKEEIEWNYKGMLQSCRGDAREVAIRQLNDPRQPQNRTVTVDPCVQLEN